MASALVRTSEVGTVPVDAPASNVMNNRPTDIPIPPSAAGAGPPDQQQQQVAQHVVVESASVASSPVRTNGVVAAAVNAPASNVMNNRPICIPICCWPQSTSPSAAPAAGADRPNPVVVKPTCEGRINNLVDLQIKKGETGTSGARKKLVAKEALREWTEDQRELQGKVERRTKQTDKIIYEIYQLIGLYSVFVGVVFTAAVQSARLRCQHIWSPVLLCAVAWLIIILVTQKRWRKYKYLRATIKSEDDSRREIYGLIGKLKLLGHREFKFETHAKEKEAGSSDLKRKTPYTICGVRASTSRIIPSVLTALTLILVGSFIHIMCYEEIASHF